MKWKGRKKSSNVEDKRSSSGAGGLAFKGGGIGIIVIIIFTLLGGGNLGDVLGNLTSQELASPSPYEETQEDRELSEFVSVVLADTEEVWGEIFEENDLKYREPTLVLFNGNIKSACGVAGSSMGPFYCPPDEKLYIDLSFYDDLSRKYGAPGDFAMAYVISHEVGHHVQKLLGISEQVQSLRSEISETEYNKYSVMLELQADYFAGVWAHHEEKLGVLDEGDIAEALGAASAVGDDRLQKQATGTVIPDSFTHGTSKQRSDWFLKGYKSGTIKDGDTFNDRSLR